MLHAANEQLLGSFRQVINDQLMMHWNRLHHFINHFAVDFCAHNVDLWPVCVSDFEKTNPIAVADFAVECVGDFIVETETVSDLEEKRKLRDLLKVGKKWVRIL
jgi:hypothetical protein